LGEHKEINTQKGGKLIGVIYEDPKERPNWLVNSRENQMELDGYNKSLGLAFEVQGEQHYHAVTHFNQTLKDLEQRIEDDLTKLELCKQNNVILIQIPYYVHPSNIQQYITTKYDHLSNKRLPIIPKIDYNKFFNTNNAQKRYIYQKDLYYTIE